jgi:endonuclease III
MKTEERYSKIIEWFQSNMPEAKTELDFKSPYELLVAVILSAQCTDKRVNSVTPALFNAFPTPEVLAAASSDQVFAYIKSISYPNNKAKSLVGMAQKVVSDFGGLVPSTMEELLTLPGVGRKTASVVLICAFDKPAMPVDTHVFRVANRLGLTTNSKSPEETEKTLMQHFPEEMLSIAHHWLILHGRYVCQARKPLCELCGLRSWCKEYPLRRKDKAE